MNRLDVDIDHLQFLVETGRRECSKITETGAVDQHGNVSVLRFFVQTVAFFHLRQVRCDDLAFGRQLFADFHKPILTPRNQNQIIPLLAQIFGELFAYARTGTCDERYFVCHFLSLAFRQYACCL
ncbi:hypothetical protein SDC9_168701 [bioreactor metagenome]|uniref:Uncharacterized protein n=1 Tax=bioreactor metagenome TaxID=1076179 RepID=A0A645G5S8_9ZZZZ